MKRILVYCIKDSEWYDYCRQMMELLRDIYYNYEVGGDVDKKIEKLLGDLL